MCEHAATVDLPNRGDQIKYLKYIGPLFARRFRAEGIRTMQDLVDTVSNQTRAQNTAQWRRIFANQRATKATKCVDHTSRRPTRPWQIAWPDHRQPVNPTGITLPHQAALDALQARYYPNTDGEYQYCVRAYNKCAWESTRDYLLRKGLTGRRRRNFRGRIPLSVERENEDWCRTAAIPWCLVPPDESSSEDDNIIVPGINLRGIQIPGVRMERRPTRRISRRQSSSSSSAQGFNEDMLTSPSKRRASPPKRRKSKSRKRTPSETPFRKLSKVMESKRQREAREKQNARTKSEKRKVTNVKDDRNLPPALPNSPPVNKVLRALGPPRRRR